MIIVAQSTYTTVEVGLHTGSELVQLKILDKKDACSLLIPTLDQLLLDEGATRADIRAAFINNGPGPFTSLRTVITTMNGIAYALHIPLYASSVLEVLNHIYARPNRGLIVLLNAYGKELYYGLSVPGEPLRMGCDTAPAVWHMAQEHHCTIVGHTEVVQGLEKRDNTYLPEIIPVPYCTLAELATYTLSTMNDGAAGSYHVSPLYLKTHF